MNPKAQQIAVAKLHGFSGPFETGEEGFDDGDSDGLETVLRARRGGTPRVRVPDYLNDLNAINQVVLGKLNVESSALNRSYAEHLGRITGSGKHVTTALIHATAAQRVEALLKTLNLWDDSK